MKSISEFRELVARILSVIDDYQDELEFRGTPQQRADEMLAEYQRNRRLRVEQ